MSSMYNNPYFKLLRVNHWFKNIFIFVGLGVGTIYVGESWNTSFLYKSIGVFFLASAISSANYIVNQITDAKFDAKHPEKKDRPLPSGDISFFRAAIIAIVLIFLVLITSYIYFSLNLLIAFLALGVAGILYNIQPIRLKDIPYVDVLAESINNPIRFLIGWYAVVEYQIPPIPILLFSWFAGAILMTAKRYDELKYYGKDLIPYRYTFNTYTLGKLRMLIYFYTFISLALLAFIEWNYEKILLILWPAVTLFFVWVINMVLSGRAKARSVESFVLTGKFSIFAFILIILSLILIFI